MDASLQKSRHKPDRLSALPPDLLLEIFTNLSVREMCCTRVLNNAFRRFVDANQQVLLKPTISFHQERIKLAYDICANIGDISFVEMFKRWMDFYGHIPDQFERTVILNRLSCRYRHIKHQGLSNEVRDFRAVFLIVIGEYALSNSVKNSNDAAWNAKMTRIDANIRSVVPPTDVSLGAVLESFMSVVKTPRLRKEGPEQSGFLGIFPRWRLIPEEFDLLATSLDIPPRPSSLYLDLWIAYCPSGREIWDLARTICSERGGETTLFEKAAILEDIIVW